MATALSANAFGKVLGPVNVSSSEEAVTITFTNQVKGFMLLGDGDWLYHSTAAQTDMLPVKANQAFTLNSQSATDFVFYAKCVGTVKLYVVPMG